MGERFSDCTKRMLRISAFQTVESVTSRANLTLQEREGRVTWGRVRGSIGIARGKGMHYPEVEGADQ